MTILHLPIAARVGATNVAVAQGESGRWNVVLWSKDEGSSLLGVPTDYGSALNRAQDFVSRNEGCVLQLPGAFGHIHIWRSATGGGFEVTHEGSTGESFALLKRFGEHQRDDAVRYAISQLGQYQPCRLGAVEL